jgi:hypothetical protein
VPSSACTAFGTDGDDILVGTPVRDVLCGFGGDDQLEGGAGDDTLLGGTGDDVLIGGEGTDCMVGERGRDSADSAPGDVAVVERSPVVDRDITGVDLNAEGMCRIVERSLDHDHIPLPRPRFTGPDVPRAKSAGPDAGTATVGAPHGNMVVSSSARPSSGYGSPAAAPSEALIGLPGSATVTVKKGEVRVRIACSATTWAALVMVAGSKRIAHKRFTCKAPGRALRVRLNKAGRTLVDQDDKVRARVLVLAGGQVAEQQVQLVSRRG